MGQGSSRLNWTCTCEDGKFNISATYQEIPQEDQQESSPNKHQGVRRSVPTRAAAVRRETLMPIIDDEMQDETGKGPAMNKKGSSTGMRRTFSSYELAQPRPSNASTKRTPTTQVPKQYRSHEVLSSNSSAANTTESSGLSQSNSENSLHSSKSADSKLQRFIGLSNASKARQQQQIESSSRKSSIVNGLPTERKSSLNSSTASTVSTTDRKSSVGDIDSLTELLKKKKKDARRAEIVANVTRRLYNTKKPEPKPEPVIEPPKPPQPEEDDVEPEELKLCMRARLQALSKRALNIHRGRRKGTDVEAQTDFQQQVLRVKEVAIGTRDIFSEEFPLGYQVYDSQKQHLYLSDQAAWITFTRLFDPYRDFYSYPSMRGQNNIWGNFHTEPKSLSSEDTFSDDSLEEVQVKPEEHSQPKVCGIIRFGSGDRFAPYEDSRTCSTQTDCCNICNGNHVPLPMETNHCRCKKSTPEVQVTLFNGLPLTGSEESQASVDDGYSSSNKEDEEANVNNHDSPMLEIPDVDRMLYTITENSEQNSDCNEILSMENIDISKPPVETPCSKMLGDKVVQVSPEVFSLCYCKLQNNGTTLCSIKLNECLNNTSCDKIVQVSGYCDFCFYKEKCICSSQKFASSDILPVSNCCLCVCPCGKKLVPTLCSCAVQCSLDKENLKDKTTQTNFNVQKSCCSHGSTGPQCTSSICYRQTDALLCEICSRRLPPDKSAENENGKHFNSCCLCSNKCVDCLSEKKNVDTVLKADAGTNTSKDLQVLPKLQNQLQLLFGVPQVMKMSTLQYEDSIALFFGSPNSQPTMVRMVTRESVGIQTESKNIYHCTSPPPQIVSVVESAECYTPKTNTSDNEHQWSQPSTSAATLPLPPEEIHCTEEDNLETNYTENCLNNIMDDNSLDDFSDEDDMPSLPRTTILPPEADSQNWSEMKNLILGRNKNLFPFYELSIEQDDNLCQRSQKKKSVSWSDLSGCGALHTEMVFDECLFESSLPMTYNSEQRSIQEVDVPELKRVQPNEVDGLLRPIPKRRQIKKLCDMPRRSWSMLDMKDVLRRQIKGEQQLSAFLHEATTLIQNLSQATINHNEANINSINNNINTSFRSLISPPRCDHESNPVLLNRCSTDNHSISKASKEHFNKDSRNLFPCRVYQKYCSHKGSQWKTPHHTGNCNLNLQEYDCLDNRYQVSEEINHYWHCHCQFVVPQKTFRNSPKAYMQHLVAIRRQIIQATSSCVQH